MKNSGSVLGGGLLVAGTCKGAGMLGLPIATAAAGFYPTLAAFLFVWLVMTISAFAYAEVLMRFKTEVNLISIAELTLGKTAKWLAWVVYILLLFSLMAAYTSGGTSMFAKMAGWQIHDAGESLLISFLFAIPYVLVVYFGAVWVDRLNRLLMLGLIFTFIYMCFLFLGTSPTHTFYAVGDGEYLFSCLPLLVTSFGYQALIPSLKNYFHGDSKKLRLAIIFGSLFALLIFAVWEYIILSLIPVWGEHGLLHMLHAKTSNPAEAMAQLLHVHGRWLHLAVSCFSYFALTSSFIAVGLGIFDFLADGLKINKNKLGRLILALLTFVPPILYTVIYPQGFLLALKYAGIFAAILLIIYPVLMAWSARYVHKLPGNYRMFGGKPVLIFALLFGVFVMFADVLQRVGFFPVP